MRWRIEFAFNAKACIQLRKPYFYPSKPWFWASESLIVQAIIAFTTQHHSSATTTMLIGQLTKTLESSTISLPTYLMLNKGVVVEPMSPARNFPPRSPSFSFYLYLHTLNHLNLNNGSVQFNWTWTTARFSSQFTFKFTWTVQLVQVHAYTDRK